MSVDYEDNETFIPVNQNHRQYMNSGCETAFIGSWGSSSSSAFLTTSFGSELDSNDADLDDDDEFIAQLTRQMADYMLQENDGSGGNENPHSKNSGSPKRNFQEPTYNQTQEQTRRSYADAVKKSIVGFQSEQILTGDKQIQPPIQVENQPRIGGQTQCGEWGSRGKMNESTQHMKPHRHDKMHSNRGVRRSKEFINGGKGYGSSMAVGSGMQAIFLGGSGPRNMMSGTGVFFPRPATDATDKGRKKPGCSTVLVPTRVLQALEQHFNNMESLSSSKVLVQAHPNHQVEKDRSQARKSLATDHQKLKLPQEWIY